MSKKIETPVIKTDVTPDGKEVNADSWDTMSVNELYQQLIILQERLFTAQSMGNLPLAKQVERGIKQLKGIISTKTDGSGIF